MGRGTKRYQEVEGREVDCSGGRNARVLFLEGLETLDRLRNRFTADSRFIIDSNSRLLMVYGLRSYIKIT